MFGFLSTTPSKSILKQLEDVREKVLKTQELTGKYNKRMEELNKLNKVLTSGYVNNLRIVVDLSKLVTEYRDTINEVINVMKKFDEMILKDIQNTDIEHVKELTNTKLVEVNEFFQKDVENVKTLLASLGKTDVISKLDKSKENFADTYRQGLETYTTIKEQSGAGKRRKIRRKYVKKKP